ncbi:MAG TPA: tetratricopeptide repeat protein, partial [bacterium]|nr:tetratricopeptide repeat protein [bacterium]
MILLFLSLFLFSQDFEDAVRHYEQGKLSEALAVLDDISGKETRREEVKNLLIKILTELGMELSFQERYEEAFSYFEKALALDPGDSFLKEIHATTQGLLRESREKGKMEEKKEEAAVPGKSSPA